MISARSTLTHLGISIDSPAAAMQAVRNKIDDSKTPLNEAKSIISNITGLQYDCDDVRTATHVAQHIVLTYITHDEYDEGLALLEAIQKAAKIRAENGFMFVKGETSSTRGQTMETVIEGIDCKVAVSATTGKIKKGGKQILTAELYKKYVTDAEVPATNTEFVQILIKELGLSKSCAGTYSYNARKFAKQTVGQ